MILVSIDGVDCTGKSSLIEGLIDHYSKQNLRLEYLHFPRYNTELGKIIRRVLSREITMHPASFQMLCSADRLEWSMNEYPKMKDEFDVVLVDRHTTSGLVYGLLDGLDKEEILQNDRRIVKPDINIILYANVDVLLKRLADRGETTTLYEKKEIMEKALGKYMELYKYYPSIFYINAEQSKAEVLREAVDVIDAYCEKT
jgi:dTMP kinase